LERNYHHEDLKNELIQKGLKILNREGYEGFSLRKAARACGVSQTAPYRHFRDKDELITAIAIHALREFNSSLESAAAKGSNPEEQLKEIGVAYVHFFTENPEYLKLLFLNDHEAYMGDICPEEDHYKEGHPFATFFNAVKRYKEARANETRSVDEMVLYGWGLVHGISVLIAFGQIPGGADCLSLADNIIRNAKF
jgi:AcrR family transcriptional regulator